MKDEQENISSVGIFVCRANLAVINTLPNIREPAIKEEGF
jgi:hypothetical protein